jgi:starch synthase
MRLVLISLARRGGMVHFHAELANSLHKIAPETKVITSRSVPSSFYSPAIPRLVVNTGQGPAGSLLYAINPLSWCNLYKLLQGSRADIFHIVASHEWNPLLAQLIGMLGKPLVFTMHDPEHHLGTSIAMRASDSTLIRKSNAIIVLSQLGNDQLRKKGIARDRIFQIPHGVYSFFLRWRPEQVAPEKVILFFGRIEPYKGLDLLLKAFFRVADDLPGWKLVIAGNGDLSSFRSALQHPQIEVNNKYVPDEEVSVLMERSRMIVLPYTEATQSGVIPVAYAFARPVIATDVGSLKEMVIHGRTGLLVPPNDAEQLAQAIKTLAVDDALCSQMGRHAYEMSMNEWSWERIAQKHLEVYSKVLWKYDEPTI